MPNKDFETCSLLDILPIDQFVIFLEYYKNKQIRDNMKFFYIIIILAFTANSNFAAESDPYGGITINNPNLWERDERDYVAKHFTPQAAKTFSLVSKDAYDCVQLRGHIKIKHGVTRENVIIFLKSNGSFIKSLDLTNDVYIDQEYLEH